MQVGDPVGAGGVFLREVEEAVSPPVVVAYKVVSLVEAAWVQVVEEVASE